MASKTNRKAVAPASDRVGQLQTLDAKSGKPPRERLKDASALHSIYTTALLADQKSAFNRVLLQQDADGAPPVDQAKLDASGIQQFNLNYLSGDTKLQAALVAYSDLLEGTTELVTPEFHPKEIAPEEMQDAADVIGEEHSRLVRENSDFYSTWERLGSEFTKFGVGFAYFSDEKTPWWDAAGWNEFVMPRRTKVGDEKIPVLMWEHAYRVHELYKYISDPEHTNWNVEEVQRAIVMACRTPTKDRPWQTFWPELAEMLKNNDIGFAFGNVEEVRALHSLVREFDGSVSFYIGLINGSNEKHLYKDVSRYERMTQAVVSFTLGVGNGTYHSIRGLLWKMHPFNQSINRLNNKLLTQTELAMSVFLQATDAESLDDMSITLAGPVAYFPPADKATIVTHTIPDVGTQGMPVIEHLNQSLANATGQFESSHGSTQPDARHNISKFQYASEQEHAGVLTNNSVNRFYRSLDRLMAEQFRRIQKIGPKSKDYPEVADFYERCDERGVPAEVIQKAVRIVKCRRAIGNGSPAMRALAMDRLGAQAGNFDATGRNLLSRDTVAVSAGRQAADRYCPRQKRIAPDAQVAILENALLRSGEVPVLPDQQHGIHASVHVPEFQKAIEQLVAVREQNPEASFEPLKPVLQYAFNLHNHSAQHVEQMVADPLLVKDAKAYKAALEQGGNLAASFARQLAAQERHQIQSGGLQNADGANAETQQLDKQQQYNAVNASTHQLEFAAQRNEQELRHKEELHQLEIQLASSKVAAVAQQMRLRDVETAANLRANSDKAKAA